MYKVRGKYLSSVLSITLACECYSRVNEMLWFEDMKLSRNKKVKDAWNINMWEQVVGNSVVYREHLRRICSFRLFLCLSCFFKYCLLWNVTSMHTYTWFYVFHLFNI